MRVYTLFLVSFILAICLSITPRAVKASNRVALVVGNSDYQLESLETPIDDAQDISAALSSIGFEVITLTNANRRELLEGLNTITEKLRSAEVGLFYFAGHGVQMDGVNYLLPLKAIVHSAVDIEYEAVHLNRVLDKMGEARNQLKIVILDACRVNPFSGFLANPSQGLAPVELPPEMIIFYAASPGSDANEGTGKNSIFTKHLISALEGKELTVQGWFDAAVAGVLQETNQQQTPWTKSSNTYPVYLIGTGPSKIESAPQQPSSVKEAETIKEIAGSATQWGRLEITTWPGDAKIRVLNIGPKYQSGMKLPAGRYQVEISRAGYKSLKQWVEIASEEYAEYDLELQQAYSGSGESLPISSVKQNKGINKNQEGLVEWAWLEVIPYPGDARIRVLNIRPKYKPGMKLSPGRYHIEVSKEGYKTVKKWIELAPGERGTFNVEIENTQSGSVPNTSIVKHSKVGDPSSTIGRTAMDNIDRQRLDDAFEYGVSGQKASWINSNSGNDFQVIPQPAFSNRSNNKICRRAEIVATIDRISQKTTIMACRNSRGEWIIDK